MLRVAKELESVPLSPNFDRALEWHRRGAEAGSREGALAYVAHCFGEHRPLSIQSFVISVPGQARAPSLAERRLCLRFLHEHAERGDAQAMGILGRLLTRSSYDGRVHTPARREGLAWLRRACEAGGDPDDLVALAESLKWRDEAEEREHCLQRAAELGHSRALLLQATSAHTAPLRREALLRRALEVAPETSPEPSRRGILGRGRPASRWQVRRHLERFLLALPHLALPEDDRRALGSFSPPRLSPAEAALIRSLLLVGLAPGDVRGSWVPVVDRAAEEMARGDLRAGWQRLRAYLRVNPEDPAAHTLAAAGLFAQILSEGSDPLVAGWSWRLAERHVELALACDSPPHGPTLLTSAVLDLLAMRRTARPSQRRSTDYRRALERLSEQAQAKLAQIPKDSPCQPRVIAARREIERLLRENRLPD